MDLITILEKLVGPATSAWQRHRFGARATIDLGWQRLPIITIPGPTPRWRAIRLIVTASKKDEFVVAKGSVEAKAGTKKRPATVADLDDHLNVPFVVEPNRQWEGTISGSSLADKLRSHASSSGVVLLRLILEDLHKGKIRSGWLTVSLEELEKKEYT